MKHIITSIAIALAGLCAFADIYTVDVTKTPQFAPAGKILQVQVVSTTATGTATVKSVSTVPVTQFQDVVTTYTNKTTYTYVYTNALEQTFTNTVDYVPLPLGPTVTSYTTNYLVTVATNLVPVTTATVCVTNALSDTVTCAGGVGSATPSSKFTVPNDPVFYEGTAAGRVLLIIER